MQFGWCMHAPGILRSPQAGPSVPVRSSIFHKFSLEPRRISSAATSTTPHQINIRSTPVPSSERIAKQKIHL
ncbi:hypothetical protein PtA15_5A483 [Puccinia triticina]|uniref:Uncharacterized protein n=1 Tax=Puccinia triticina TaxID=208348 RepID=A0ABY7CIK1_9BASI|nr:uncharacterized protein PtA15_5A483 [Puccinia triticina]WAQ84910.1 hypothetical protein PtA15_5A483 [Puccinia triticina]